MTFVPINIGGAPSMWAMVKPDEAVTRAATTTNMMLKIIFARIILMSFLLMSDKLFKLTRGVSCLDIW